jgi:hypothetical protein
VKQDLEANREIKYQLINFSWRYINLLLSRVGTVPRDLKYNTSALMLPHAVIVSGPTEFKPRVIHTTIDAFIVITNQIWLHPSTIELLDARLNIKVNFFTIWINPYNNSP